VLGRVIGLVLGLILLGGASSSRAGDVLVVTIDGSINPASADYLIGAIARADEENAAAVLIELDTPGGLVSATQDIIQAMLNASVPTIVYVRPRGATATSAGTFITLASNVAAMMPGTSIGAAHPVSLFGGNSTPASPPSEDGASGEDQSSGKTAIDQKIENFLAAYVESIAKQRKRNVEWAIDAVRNSVAVTAEEALELGVIDVIADNRRDLFAAIEGREVEVDGQMQKLAVVGAPVVLVEKTLVQAIFDFLSDPNVATILFAIGAIGLYLEFQSPGMILPGTVGVVAMILLGFALQILPFSWIGVLLVLVGVGLLIAELFITSFGLLFAAGATCFLIGGTMVFHRPEVSDLTVSFWEVLVPIVAAMTVMGAFIAYSLGRTFSSQQTAGVEEMIGLIGRCEMAIDPKGKIFVHGEYWTSISGERIDPGEAVEVMGIEGLTLRVRRSQRDI